MIPLFRKLVPKAMLPADPPLEAKFDNHVPAWESDIKALRYLLQPERCPVALLDELVQYLGADITPGASETLKRQEIASAFNDHKRRWTFEEHIKPIIDRITGLDSQVLVGVGFVDGFFPFMTGSTNYPSDNDILMGGDVNYPDSHIMTGDNRQLDNRAYVMIDLGGDAVTPTAAIIAQVKESLLVDPPAFLIILLGYLDGSSKFQLYSNGVV